jgi:type II secretory pathway component PulF
LRLFIDWVSFNADYLNSVWVAVIPALVGAAAISYFVPSQWVQRTWTSWLLIVPIGGLIVLGSSLMQYFVR